MANQTIKFSLTAIEARDLLSGDSNGLSDPYFLIPKQQRGVIDLPKKKNRTKTIMKTLNPVWNHTFEMEYNPQACNKLLVEVYDYDYIGKDDHLGTGEIPLDWMSSGQRDLYEEWIPLKITKKDKKTKLSQTTQKGSVHVKLQVKFRPGQQPVGQPPMGQAPYQPPPMGQQPYQPPPSGQPPYQPPPMGQQPYQPPPSGQPPYQPPPSGQPPYQPPPSGQPPYQPPPSGQPPYQPPPSGQPPYQPPPNGSSSVQSPPLVKPNLKPVGSTSVQSPPLVKPNLKPVPGQPQAQYSQPPTQPPVSQPPAQYSQPPPQSPMGQPPAQYPNQYGQPPVQPPPAGQPPAQYPNQYSQPPPAQPGLNRMGTLAPQPMPNQFPPKPQLHRPQTFQEPSYRPPMQPPGAQPYPYGAPPMQHTAMPPQPYALPHAPYYPPQYSQPPLSHSMMPMARPMSAQVPSPMGGVNIIPPRLPPGVNFISNFRRGDELQPGSWIPVCEPTVLVGLGWDFTGYETFDLDASVTGFDFQFNVVDTIYFNHKKGLNGSVIHFGDNLTGEGEGDDEVIKVILSQVPRSVQYLAVTINSFKKNSLIRARSAYIRIFTHMYHIGKYTLRRTKDCIGLLLGVFERSPDPYVWYFRVMADPIRGNKVTLSYEDIKALLGGYSIYNFVQRRVHHPLPGEPLIEFNRWIKLPNRFMYIGLGWNIQQGANYDLDASIITFDRMNMPLEFIYHRNLQSFNGAIIHYGDNRTGLGEGDDEVLSIDFGRVDPNAFTMVAVVNSFKGNSMLQVYDAFIRIYDTQKFIGVHVLNKCPDCIGLCLGIFKKGMDGIWSFCAVKDPVSGIECTQSVNDLKFVLDKHPYKP